MTRSESVYVVEVRTRVHLDRFAPIYAAFATRTGAWREMWVRRASNPFLLFRVVRYDRVPGVAP